MGRKAPIITAEELLEKLRLSAKRVSGGDPLDADLPHHYSDEKILAVNTKRLASINVPGLKVTDLNIDYKAQECLWEALRADGFKKWVKDVGKVQFDFENISTVSDYPDSDLLGLVTLPNGFTFLGISGGGDWEHQVFCIAYWDGNSIRGYVPSNGNTYCRATKAAFNQDIVDDKIERKELVSILKKNGENANIDDDDGDFDECLYDKAKKYLVFDSKTIVEDIMKRIELVSEDRSMKAYNPEDCYFHLTDDPDLEMVLVTICPTSFFDLNGFIYDQHFEVSVPDCVGGPEMEGVWSAFEEIETVRAAMLAHGFKENKKMSNFLTQVENV